MSLDTLRFSTENISKLILAPASSIGLMDNKDVVKDLNHA